MELVRTIKEARTCLAQARSAGRRIGLVPTMGALHEGHASLIRIAKENSDYVVVSIFVNPTQFGPSEDFNRYPRTLEADSTICSDLGVDLLFAPSAEEMYPAEQLSWVMVEKITEKLCGKVRPGHFRGVTTVCTKLFHIIGPDCAFFGQKDAQQAIVLQKMVQDLNFPLEIVIGPTIRDPDGLAISSRNAYLTPEQRNEATLLHKALCACEDMILKGEKDAIHLKTSMADILSRSNRIRIEYISISDPETLEEVQKVGNRILAALAVYMDSVRLIDNILLDVNK